MPGIVRKNLAYDLNEYKIISFTEVVGLNVVII